MKKRAVVVMVDNDTNKLLDKSELIRFTLAMLTNAC
jgi:hypothetical protein